MVGLFPSGCLCVRVEAQQTACMAQMPSKTDTVCASLSSSAAGSISSAHDERLPLLHVLLHFCRFATATVRSRKHKQQVVEAKMARRTSRRMDDY